MSTLSHETTLYDVLEVSESASTEAIQRAYFRLIRACRPLEEIEYYQALNHAREVLSSSERRGEYDQNRRNGPRVRVLLDQAAVALERDPQKALSLLKSAVTLAPEMIRPRLLLTQVLLRTKEYAIAERQYYWLLQRLPNDEQLRCKLARCLILQNKHSEAEAELHKVLEINPAYYDAQLMLARLYRTMNRIPELITTLEEAILTDDIENFADFNLLLQLLLVHIQQGDQQATDQVVHRLLAVIPESQVPAAAEAFLRTAEFFFQEECYLWAKTLLTQALLLPLAPEDPLRQKLLETIWQAELSQETLQADRDSLLIGPLQECFRVLYRDRSSEAVRESRMGAAFAQMQKEYESNPRHLLQQLEYLRREYPLLTEDQAVFLGQLSQRAHQRVEQLHQLQLRTSAPTVRSMAAPEPVPEAKRPGLLSRLRGGR